MYLDALPQIIYHLLLDLFFRLQTSASANKIKVKAGFLQETHVCDLNLQLSWQAMA